MEKKLEIVCVLDRSGSMSGKEKDTIGGYNGLLNKERENCPDSYVTTVLFDDRYETLIDRKKISEVPALTEKEYYVRGCTALLDAIGKTVSHIENIHRYIRKEDIPEHTVFMITTDGLENASREYSLSQVREMITRLTEKEGWEFLFFGANIDAIGTARAYGIRETNAVNYHNDEKGIQTVYEAACCAMNTVRECGSLKEDTAWRKKADKDYKSRK